MFKLNGIQSDISNKHSYRGNEGLYKDTQIPQEQRQQDTQYDETEEEIRGAAAMEVDSHNGTRESSISSQITNKNKKKREEEETGNKKAERREDLDKHQLESRLLVTTPNPPPYP